MVLIIWLIALAFAIGMLKRNAIKVEKEHARRRKRYLRLLEQLKEPTNDAVPGNEE